MQTEVTKVSLWIKIHKAKMSIGKVVKNSTNPHFKKSYADINALLETVEPILHENGLLLLQPIHDKILSTQIIDIETGEMILLTRRCNLYVVKAWVRSAGSDFVRPS